jgi:5-methylcytosine-specific restriction endonuclease McrA
VKSSPMPRREKPLTSKTPIKPRSKKMQAKYRIRRPLVAELLAERPWCEIRWDDGCQGRAVDVDEILSRARSGDFLDPDNCQTTCRHCHDRKHDKSLEAVERGVSLNSWSEVDAA